MKDIFTNRQTDRGRGKVPKKLKDRWAERKKEKAETRQSQQSKSMYTEKNAS